MAKETAAQSDDTPAESEQRSNRSSFLRAAFEDPAVPTMLAALSAAAVAVVGYWFFLLRRGEHDLLNALQFAGSNTRLTARLGEVEPVVSVDQARDALWWSIGFTVLWGVVGWALLTFTWKYAWKSGVGRQSRDAGPMLGWVLGAGAAVVGVIEKAITFFGIEQAGSAVQFSAGWKEAVPKAIITLAWVKWILAGIMTLLGVAILVSAATAGIRRQSTPRKGSKAPATLDPLPDPADPVPEPAGLGISCSGGGLRSAAFMLGALGRLEIDPDWAKTTHGLGLLGDAQYLSSVSGGGYTASAWRIAAGTDDTLPSEPIIGDPTSIATRQAEEAAQAKEAAAERVAAGLKPLPVVPELDIPRKTLIEFVRARRVYLANGPGGLWRSVVDVVAKMAFHFSLLLLFVYVLAWPLGRVLVTWALTGDGLSGDAMDDGITERLNGAQLFPLKVLAVLVGALAIGRFFMQRGPWRKRLDLAMYGLFGLLAALFVVTVAVPHLVDLAIRQFGPADGSTKFAVAGVYGAVLTALWQVAKVKLQSMAPYLGGVVLVLGLLFFAFVVMGHAADTDELLSEWWYWLIGFGALVVAFIGFNPDRWSLHSFYRRRLAGTFAPMFKDGYLVPHDNEPPIWAYQNVQGPMPIVCCAAARDSADYTGVAALSMTLDPHQVTVHGWKGAGAKLEHDPRRMSHAKFEQRLPQNRYGGHIHTLMGAAAISGAAVAPSLGRKSLRGTDALFAAFNARLGTWVPNPNSDDYPRHTTPRLVNMFKEITKTYDEKDPNVYATDGGHWENLGLVELIRRRCAVMIAIDASADVPGSYKVLRDAIRLAELECDAQIEITPEGWADLEMSDEQLTTRTYARGTVTYSDGTVAELLFVKAVVSEESPLQIQRFSANDPKFPNYSTANQLLGAEALGHLIELGHRSMDQALKANHGLVVKALKVAAAGQTA